MIEQAHGVEPVRPQPLDAAGEIIQGPAIETPVRRFTATDAAKVAVLIGFRGGLLYVDKKGRLKTQNVAVRIRARPDGIGDWRDVETLDIIAARREGFVRVHRWALPQRGRWQIGVTRMTDDTTSTSVNDRCSLAAIQSIRPECPLNIDRPLALIALRVRATHQLNGPLDSFNTMVEPGRTYDLRFVFRRWQESGDPLNDAVECMWVALGADKSVVGSGRYGVPVAALMADGRIECGFTASRDRAGDVTLW